jgi:hypothetical protein
MGSGDTADQSVQAQAGEGRRSFGPGICGWVEAQLAQLPMEKAVGGLNMTEAENSACTRGSSKRRAEAR